MKTSSVEFISRSPNPLPMKSEHRRFSSGLHGSTAADSVQSEWPLWHAAKSKTQVFARRRIELKLKQKLLDIRAEKERSSEGERERNHRSEAIAHRLIAAEGSGRLITTTEREDSVIAQSSRLISDPMRFDQRPQRLSIGHGSIASTVTHHEVRLQHAKRIREEISWTRENCFE
ncbi:hypothetical protein TNCV_1959561 [Trichonephila clavipes]|nr:hypothetical protein TNCV_1959561 [Trichonephila clavipes]